MLVPSQYLKEILNPSKNKQLHIVPDASTPKVVISLVQAESRDFHTSVKVELKVLVMSLSI